MKLRAHEAALWFGTWFQETGFQATGEDLGFDTATLSQTRSPGPRSQATVPEKVVFPQI